MQGLGVHIKYCLFVNYFSNCKSVPQFLGGAVFLSTTMFHPDMKIPSTLNLIRDSSSPHTYFNELACEGNFQSNWVDLPKFFLLLTWMI